MAEKYFITGDIVGADTPNYGEKRVEIGGASAYFVEAELSAGAITLKEKAKTLYEAYKKGSTIIAKMTQATGEELISCIYFVSTTSRKYRFAFFWGQDLAYFDSATDDAFPTMEISG